MAIKCIAVGCITFLIGGFISLNIEKYRTLTGMPEFSAFEGWQIASNALYAYAHAKTDPAELVPPQYRELHTLVIRQKDSLRNLSNRPDNQLGIYYLWDEHAPLRQYLKEKWQGDSVTNGFKKWASMGPTYEGYGIWLIRNHQISFIRYFLWPNMINYYVPNAEYMGVYNMGKDSIDNLAKSWFEFPTGKVSPKNKNIAIMKFYPFALATINVVFALSLCSFWLLDGFKKLSNVMSRPVRLMAIEWFMNFLFSVFASPIVLRYQVFPMIITSVFAVYLILRILRDAQLEQNKGTKSLKIVIT
jgi:hypothetical protein